MDLTQFSPQVSVSPIVLHGSTLHTTGPDYQSYLSRLPVDAHPHLERQLDWGHEGVDRDLNEIANHSLDWEEKLSVPLGLTATDISDIKTMHQNKPQLQR